MNAKYFLIGLGIQAMLVTLGAAPALAQNSSPATGPVSADRDAGEHARQLQLQLEEIRSARGQFEQMIREADGYLLDRQTGTFSLQKPRLLRWEISELDQLLVSDGETLYLYDELFQQVTLRTWSSDPSVNPAAILLDDIWLGDWTAVSKQGETWILQPFGRATSISEIRLQLDQGFPAVLVLEDFSGQITEIRFSEVETNVELDADQFQFQIPPGVELLYDEAGQ